MIAGNALYNANDNLARSQRLKGCYRLDWGAVACGLQRSWQCRELHNMAGLAVSR